MGHLKKRILGLRSFPLLSLLQFHFLIYPTHFTNIIRPYINPLHSNNKRPLQRKDPPSKNQNNFFSLLIPSSWELITHRCNLFYFLFPQLRSTQHFDTPSSCSILYLVYAPLLYLFHHKQTHLALH